MLGGFFNSQSLKVPAGYQRISARDRFFPNPTSQPPRLPFPCTASLLDRDRRENPSRKQLVLNQTFSRRTPLRLRGLGRRYRSKVFSGKNWACAGCDPP